jgi:hypothetical protein
LATIDPMPRKLVNTCGRLAPLQAIVVRRMVPSTPDPSVVTDEAMDRVVRTNRIGGGT